MTTKQSPYLAYEIAFKLAVAVAVLLLPIGLISFAFYVLLICMHL